MTSPKSRWESDRVAQRLRDEIVTGQRRPGSRLVEREIAGEFGVSRVPVRDALKLLASEGLVAVSPHSSAVVREFSESDITDLYEVRTAIEGMAFRLAAQRHSRDGLARLRSVLDDGIAAAESGDATAARRAAADFHDVVVELPDNTALVEAYAVIRARMRWLLGQHDDLLEVAREHEEIYRAIAARDVVRVDELVSRHVSISRELQRKHTRASAG